MFPIPPQQQQTIAFGQSCENLPDSCPRTPAINLILHRGALGERFVGDTIDVAVERFLRHTESSAIDILNLVARNAHQPGAQRGMPLEQGEAVQGPKKNILNDVVDEIGARCQPVADVGVDRIDVRRNKPGRRLSVPSENRGNELALVGTLSAFGTNPRRTGSARCSGIHVIIVAKVPVPPLAVGGHASQRMRS